MNNTTYKASRLVVLCAAFAPFILTASNLDAQATANCQHVAFVKNLMALRTPPCIVTATGPHELTRREVKKLAASAKSPDDHLKLAAYYNTQADRLDAQGAGYEEAAAAYRHGPVVKNLMAPNTAARFETFAQRFREEAKDDRALASAQEQMAKSAVAVANR